MPAPAPKPARTAPRYMTRFRCIGPDCESSCCVAWGITLDEVLSRMVDAASDETARDPRLARVAETIARSGPAEADETGVRQGVDGPGRPEVERRHRKRGGDEEIPAAEHGHEMSLRERYRRPQRRKSPPVPHLTRRNRV